SGSGNPSTISWTGPIVISVPLRRVRDQGQRERTRLPHPPRVDGPWPVPSASHGTATMALVDVAANCWGTSGGVARTPSWCPCAASPYLSVTIRDHPESGLAGHHPQRASGANPGTFRGPSPSHRAWPMCHPARVVYPAVRAPVG